ncbi:hypothetical protein FZE49_33360, partial [Pseudomonas aeruginosa]|nr:hypothetical protein [Pseudomonas aeruginosa]
MPPGVHRDTGHQHQEAPEDRLLASGLLVTALVMVDGHGDLVDVFNVIILLGTMTGVVPYAF